MDVVGDEPGHGAVGERDGDATTTAPPDPADDFSPTFTGGDTNGNGLLDPGETWTYTASGTVGTDRLLQRRDRVGHERHDRDRHRPGVLSGAAVAPVIAIVKLVERRGREHARVGSGVDAGCAGDVDVCR